MFPKNIILVVIDWELKYKCLEKGAFMKVFNYIAHVLSGSLFFGFGVNATAGYSDYEVEGDYENFLSDSIEANCNLLVNLENKEDLTVNDEFVGRLVHDIISQVSSAPIEYCDEVHMAGITEKDPDTPSSSIVYQM